MSIAPALRRCGWVAQADPAYGRYHDREWGRPVHNIVRNRLKIESTVTNARAFLEVQKEFGSFDRYPWAFVGNRSVINRPKRSKDVPARSGLSDRISKDLKRRGFRFVGSTIVYAFLQAVGVVDDHMRGCFLARPANPSRRRRDRAILPSSPHGRG